MTPTRVQVAPDLQPFVDVEAAVIGVLADLVDGHIDIQTPADLQDQLPFIRVEHLGGQSTQLTDSPRIGVDVFGAKGDRTVTKNLALAVQARLRSYPHAIDGVGVIDRVETDTSPNQVPWNNDAILLFTASYKVTVR